MNLINVFTDGGSRGNPGEAGIGVYVVDENNKALCRIGKKIGIATNNVAEYKAVVEAYLWLIANKNIIKAETKINFFMDSELVVSQLNGIYKIKNIALQKLVIEIRKLESQVKAIIRYAHIPRENNKEADRMVNMALDNKT